MYEAETLSFQREESGGVGQVKSETDFLITR